MIAIVSSNAQERAAFSALCSSRGWPHVGCDSVRALKRLLTHSRPTVALIRHKLNDGYSDDVLTALQASSPPGRTRSIVLIAPGSASAQEARQIALGADCVQRDPARSDVLVEYCARYRADVHSSSRRVARAAPHATFRFAGASVQPRDRKAVSDGHSVALTPREIALIEFLADRCDEVVPYQTLYLDLLGRPFAGDTSNMRVLLGKLDRSLRPLGIRVRNWIEVIPKTGYRYHPKGIPAHR